MMRSFTLVCALFFYGTTHAADLTQVYHLALEHDPTFKAQQASYQANQQAVPKALAQFLPNLSGQVSTTGVHSGTQIQGNYNTKSYGLNLTQPIYHPEQWSAFEQARHLEKQALANLLASGQDLIVRVGEQYFAVLGALDDLDFARSQRKAFSRQLDQTKQRFEVGLIAITDVHEAQARHDNAVANEIAAENNLADQYEKLREITGLPIENIAKMIVSDQALLQPPEPTQLEAWVDMAQTYNLDIQGAQQAALVSKGEIANNNAGHLPKVDINASIQRDNTAPATFGLLNTRALNTQKRINLTMTLPIFEGGAVTFRVKEAQARYAEALKNLDLQRKSTYSQTRQKYRGVLTQISQVNSLSQAVVSNKSALKAIKAAYEVGTRTIVDVLDAESNLLSAIRDYSQARYAYVLEGLRLKRAAGTLKPEDLYQINTLLGYKD